MKNPYLRRKNRSPVNDVRSGTADRFYQTARLAVPILINGFPFPGKPVPMITICKEAMKRLWNHQAMRKKDGKGALVFMGRGGETREERQLADNLPRQSRVCRILCIDAGRGCRNIAAP